MLEESRNTGSFSGVHSVAVSDIKEDVFAFRWDIKQFSQRLQNKDPKFRLKSPIFEWGESNNKLQWQLNTRWNKREQRPDSNEEDQFLTIRLYLANWTTRTPTKVKFRIDILGADNSWFAESKTEHEYTSSIKSWGWSKFATIEEILDPTNRLLEDNTLKILCRIVMKNDTIIHISGTKLETERRSLKRKQDLASHYTNMLHSSSFTDILIQTKTSVLKAHKAVLSSRSPVFSAMFHSGMVESINNIVEILDFDHEVVNGMLLYIYSGELAKDFLTEKSIELFQIAEKYDIKGLKEEAEEIIAENISVQNVANTLILADVNNSSLLIDTTIKYINMNKTEVVKTEGFQANLSNYPSLLMQLYQAQ